MIDLKEIFLKIQESDLCALDLETTGLDAFSDKIISIALDLNGEIYVLTMDIPSNQIKYILDLISQKLLIVGHNIKFDLKFIYHNYKILPVNVYDTMIAECILNAGVGSTLYSLQELVEKYEGVLLDKEVRQSFYQMDSSELSAEQLEYIKNDVKYLRSIYEKQIKDAEEKKLTKVLNLEMDLIPVITTMEYFGIKIDTESWRLIFPKLEEEKKQLELEIKTMMFDSISEQISPEDNLLSIAERLCIPVKKKSERNALIQVIDLNYIRDWVIEHINLSSPKQVLSILNQMGINIPNTEESTLIDYEHENLIISKLLKYREIIKLLTTYGENILAKIHPVTGSLHPEFNQVGAATGRFSSSNPNAQNIPATPEFRKNFIARPGYKIITADYNQQEYRLAGATSGDEKIIHAYKQGHDIHTATASIAFDKSLDQVTKEERTNGKKINFLTLYGGSPKKLHKILGFPMDKATDIINKLNSSYSKLNLFRERYGEMAFEKGYSVTLLGRKRWFNKPKIYPSDKEYDIVKSRIKRQGYNTLIQGTGADIVKLAMVSCFYNNPFGLDKFRILLQVHDEIVFEVAEEIVEQAVPFIKTCMEDAEQQFLGEIPAVVEISVDNFWRK